MVERLMRSQVPEQETWNLNDLYPTHAAWEQELAALEADLPSIQRFKGRLAEGAGTLAECLRQYQELYVRLMRAISYAELKAAADGADAENQADAARAAALHARALAETAFLRPEILSLPEGAIARYQAEEPRLAAFGRFIEKILAEKPHVLHPKAEEALAALSEVTDAPYMIYSRTKSADMAFENIKDAEGNTVVNSFALYEDHLETSRDFTLRRNAYASFVAGLKRYQNAFAATFATEVTKNVVMAKLRSYPSATHMLLQSQEVSLEAYNTLLDVIQAELAPHMRRYARLRKRVLGLSEMLYCDIEAPLDPDYVPSISYEDGRKLLLDALAVMGEDYRQIIETAFAARWIDRADNVGKSTGAFCAGVYGVHPYVLLTFTGAMRGVFTLAHELGHAAHFVLAERKQQPLNLEPSLFFIEAPSTINELLLADHILAKSSDVRMRRWVIMQTLATYYHNFVRHLLEGELQRRIYALAEQGEPITASTLSQTKGAILEQFWAGEVVIDDGARLTWMRQPHYYMGLYPYTYSAGLSLATAMAKAIREEGQPAVNRWLQVLEAGGSLKPLELGRMAGVEMSGPAPFRQAVAHVGSLIDELENSF